MYENERQQSMDKCVAASPYGPKEQVFKAYPEFIILEGGEAVLNKRSGEIEGLREAVKALIPLWGKSGREAALVVTHLQEARHFINKMKGFRGSPYPYPQKGNVYAPATVAVPTELSGETLVAQVDNLRDRIQEQINMANMFDQSNAVNQIDYVCIISVIQHLMSAKHFAGEIIPLLPPPQAEEVK